MIRNLMLMRKKTLIWLNQKWSDSIQRPFLFFQTKKPLYLSYLFSFEVMHKQKTIDSDGLIGHCPQSVLSFFKDRARQKLHLLKAKVTQYHQKNYPPQNRKNLPLEKIAQNFLQIYLKKCISQRIPISDGENRGFDSYDQNPQQISNEQNIYLTNPVINYLYATDEGKKWKINLDPGLQFDEELDFIQLLSILVMFEHGFFPFLGKKQSKSKIYIQYMEKLKRRPSRMIETFKMPIKNQIIIFSLTVQKLSGKQYCMCVYIHRFVWEIKLTKIDHIIDSIFESQSFAILPGETKFHKQQLVSKGQLFAFGDKKIKFESTKHDPEVRKIVPCKIKRQFSEVQKMENMQVNKIKNFNIEIEVKKDHTNYDSVRYIYKDLTENSYLNYSLSPSEYEVLESRGNLIVIGRSGTGKTTCALLRLLFKELYKEQKTQKNVFLTASPVLIAEINKKYNELKDGISKAYDYDYFSRYQAITDEALIKKFMNRLDQINQSIKRKTFSNFLGYKSFPCFLTIREYIQSIDAVLQNPFFTVQKEKINEEKTDQIITQYPDQIQWEQKVIRTRRLKINDEDFEQDWSQINYDFFARKVWHLPEIEKRSCSLSPEIVWSQIFSTIKGSSRAHTFFYKFLDFDTYCKESKSEFLDLEDKRKLYQIFTIYEKWKQQNNQYDLVDVVNNILCGLSKRQNYDLLLTSLFIDEVQDLPPSFIFLAGKVVQQSLFFCGDTAQTIAKGVRFNFSDVRQQFSQKYFENNFKLEKPTIKQLNVNFRCQNEIIQFSNSIVRILELMFPQSIDRMPFQTSPNKGLKPLIIGSHNSILIAEIFKERAELSVRNKNNMFGADKAIIVRSKQDKKTIPEQLKNMTCLTYEECKGLQYNVVILYNFFSSNKVEWSYLKNLELQGQLNNKGMYFNKKRFSSNIKLYFQLCSELKILYTVITRPRSILIICDSMIPPQLEKIWSFFGLVNNVDSIQDYFRHENLEIQNIVYPNNNNLESEQTQLKSKLVSQHDNNYYIPQISSKDKTLSAEKFKKQWAQEGLKMFFDHKLYAQAAKCFENIGIKQLSLISIAFQFAKIACYQSKTQQQKRVNYILAAEIFQQNKRIFQAGKCYFLAQEYQSAMDKFKSLNIEKYVAECLWKLNYYIEAYHKFFNEKKYIKCFKVLGDSHYWYLFFSKVISNPHLLDAKNRRVVSDALEEGCHHLVQLFSAYLIEMKSLEKIENLKGWFQKVLFQRYRDSDEKKSFYFESKHIELITIQKKYKLETPQQKKNLRQTGQSLLKLFQKKNQQEVGKDFLNLLCYLYDLLVKYQKVLSFRKYKQTNFEFMCQDKEFQSDRKIFARILSQIFNTLESYNQLVIILYLCKLLGFAKIQQTLMVQNFIRINQRSSKQEVNQFRRQTYYQGLEYIQDPTIVSQLSVLSFLFGKQKNIGLLFQEQDTILDFYLRIENESTTKDIIQEQMLFQPEKIQNLYNLYCFKSDLPSAWMERMCIKSYLYRFFFYLMDDLSPNSFFKQNLKEKQFYEHFKKLSEQEQKQMANNCKSEVQKVLNQLNKKQQKLKKQLDACQKDKQQIFKNTSLEQTNAYQQKLKIVPFIKEYIYLPQQCQKNPRQVYELKSSLELIKRQRNNLLNDLDRECNQRSEIEQSKHKIFEKLKQLSKTHKDTSIKYYRKMQKFYSIENEEQVNSAYAHYYKAELSQYQTEIRELLSEKNGTNRKDKKLQSRIKILQNKADPIKKLLEPYLLKQSSIKYKIDACQHELELLKQQLGEIQRLQRTKFEFLVSLKLGKINDENDSFALFQTQKNCKKRIQIHVNDQKRKIKDQIQMSKRRIKQKYRPIIKDLDDYIYYHRTIPYRCRRDREDIILQLQKFKNEIDYLNEQKQKQKLITQAKTKRIYITQHFKIHCHASKKIFIKEKILQNSKVVSMISMELQSIFELLSSIEGLNKYQHVSQDLKNKNSFRLEMILDSEDYTFEKIWILLYFILHSKQIQELQQLIVPGIYAKFKYQIEQFVDNVMNCNEFSSLMKKCLSIFGINIIESIQKDQFRYFEGFSILPKNHNFYEQLKDGFIHRISQGNLICSTSDIVRILKKNIRDRAKTLIGYDQTPFTKNLQTEQLKSFNFRNKQEMKQKEYQVKGFLQQNLNQIQRTQDDIDLRTIMEIQKHLNSVKLCLVCQIVKIQQNYQFCNQDKACQISLKAKQIIQTTKLIETLREIKSFSNKDLVNVNGLRRFKSQESQKDRANIKGQIIQSLRMLIFTVFPSKQYLNFKDQSISSKQQGNSTLYEKGTQQRATYNNLKNRQKMKPANLQQSNQRKYRIQRNQFVNKSFVQSKEQINKRFVLIHQETFVEEGQQEEVETHYTLGNTQNQVYYSFDQNRWVSY